MTWIKICGITNLEDALMAVEAGADALGFVFYEKSPRNVEAEVAREIVSTLPAEVEKVGVFVDEPAAKVASIADRTGLTAVQLHADQRRFPEKQITTRKIFLSLPARAVVFTPQKKGAVWGSLLPFPENLAAIFVDSGTVGGTGRKFNWKQASMFFSAVSKLHPIAASGGLAPNNVAEAIRILKPWGVDVSSGVEARPGKKDPEKVRAFIAAVRHADKSV